MKDATKLIKFSKEELQTIKKAAEGVGLSTSAFIRTSALQKAKEIISILSERQKKSQPGGVIPGKN